MRDFVGSVLGHWRYFHNAFKTIGENIKISEIFANYLNDTEKFPNIKDRNMGENRVITPYLKFPRGYNKV